MIYTTGTIAINGNTVTGTGTNFSAPLSLIRVGCTLIAVGNPVQIFTITEIKSGTELSVTPAANPAIPAGTKFSILLSDSISVDGLAQDVAETLRYYQGRETEIAAAVEWWEDFGGEGQLDQLLADIRAETAKSTANAQKTETDKNAAEASKTAAAKSATAAKTSETNAKASETAAKTSETNAKTSENRAQEYLNQIIRSNNSLVQCNWPVTTEHFARYVKIAKLTDPGAVSCHLTLMIANGGNYGTSYGNIDFVEISARGLSDAGGVTSENIAKFLSVRRLGSPNLANDNQMRYGLVKGDGYIEVWCYQRAFIKETKVAILAQTGRTELYIPEGYVVQEAEPAGYIESPAARIYDQVNKPSKADLGLSNAMLIGAFGLGGSGPSSNGMMSNTELLKALRAKGSHFWRADKPNGSTATHYAHGSGIFSRCGDTWSAINIEYENARVKIFAGNDNKLETATYAVNELYGTQNKPSKSDVGLGNVTNDAQVKKSGDIMSGDLAVYKDTPSLFLRAKDGAGAAAVRFFTDQNLERGIIYAIQNTDTLGEVRIRAKNAKGETNGDLVVRHNGVVEVQDLTAAKKVKSVNAELANTSTNTLENTLKISGQQHTPLLLTRTGYTENLSIGFKVDNLDQKYLGINGSGDLAFGKNADHKQNSRVITQAILDSGVTVGGKTTFSDLATFNAGMAGAIEPESISEVAVDLNNLTIKGTDKGSVKYYHCRTAGGGANITNKPAGIGGNFLLRVESIRKITDSDYTNLQTLVGTDTKQIYVRYCENGNWSAWSQIVVSGRNQDVTVRSLTSTTPSKLGGGRIDVLGSTSDYNSMNCTVRGVDSSGTNSAWSVGTSVDTGKMLFLKNHRSSAQVLLNGDDGAVQLLSGTVNGATAQALTINKDEVNSTADLVIRKQTGTGNRFVLQNAGNAELPFSVSVWGSSTRQNVFEVATSAAYLFYAQRTPAGQLFDVNGAINCTTLNQSSDRDLKDDILVISDATKAIRKMNGYTYTLKENGLPYAGVIAQEVMEALPEAVGSFTRYGEELQGPTIDGNELREETRYLNVDYAAVTGLLVQVARETDNRVTELEEENASLKANIAAMDERIAKLEALISQLTGSEE
ncbi:TPA: tail fiber domain-containing protein [Escherichia coli]|uniref:pyocin knob domain-containing S74 family peptidase n=3 Tax=Escherichia coli TaxID=562 RepID=UPI00102EE9E1|nr:pyocin knob domain-containing S74 family peptidase [Escherichia coli]QBF91589.1 tail fiber domain-containing protein [Escherichia coli]HDV4831471.1 tail fiber domain-containing protein [Escherichia coli]HDV4864890.1 tail fiber domain-containing protein [Escherichia coli]HDV4874482.1 tail fiber domain-containing protein [Escherichia coli]